MNRDNEGRVTRGAFYRNRYNAEPGHHAMPVITQLVERGWMMLYPASACFDRRPESAHMYCATPEGTQVAIDHIPRKPRRLPLTKKVAAGLFAIGEQTVNRCPTAHTPQEIDAALRWIKRLHECNTYRPPLGW